MFRIPNDEQGAGLFRTPLAGKKFRDQRVNDRALIGAGILCLINQHMGQAAIQFEQHPGHRFLGQQTPRQMNKIIIIQPRRRPFVGLIGPQHRFTQPQQTLAGARRGLAAQALIDRQQPVLFGHQHIRRGRAVFGHGLHT